MSARPEPSGSKQPYPLKMLHVKLVAHLYGVNFPIQIEVTTTLIVRNHNGGINSRRAIRTYGTVAVTRLAQFIGVCRRLKRLVAPHSSVVTSTTAQAGV